MKKLYVYLSAMALALSTMGSAQAVSLKTLIDNSGNANGSIQAGDKLFDSFWFGPSSNSSFVNYDFDVLLDSITVTPLHDGGLDPGPGLNFSTTALSVTSDNMYEWIDLFFGFKVTVLDPNLWIKDNSLTLQEGFKTIADLADNGVYIKEKVGKTQGSVNDPLIDGNLGNKDVEFSWLDGDLRTDGETDDLDIVKLIDTAEFEKQKQIYVSKNILVWADAGGVPNQTVSAGLRSFDQRFSQVPEPETWIMLAVGLIGFVFNLKRNKTI